MAEIILHPEVEAALIAATPIVLLESAVLTAGMPDAPWRDDWELDFDVVDDAGCAADR